MTDGPKTNNLTGRYHVRVFAPAFSDAARLCPRTKHRMELRRHALKLRFWPAPQSGETSGSVGDLNWEWIRTIRNKKVGELRIDDVIANNDNLRLIFFVPLEKRAGDKLPTIWILAVLQKQRQSFSQNEIRTFSFRRQLVLERHYNK